MQAQFVSVRVRSIGCGLLPVGPPVDLGPVTSSPKTIIINELLIKRQIVSRRRLRSANHT